MQQNQSAINRPGNRPLMEIIRQARQGVIRRRVDEVAALVSLTDKEMAHVLNISVRSLHGKTPAEPLTLAAGERLLLLERLVEHGLTTFDGRADLLASWLRTPLAELAYEDENDAIENADPYAKSNPVLIRSLGSFEQSDLVMKGRVITDQSAAAVDKAETTDAVAAQSPLKVLDTVSGFSLAEDVLGRIDWGIV